jgi:transcriptional antiterminator NusG
MWYAVQVRTGEEEKVKHFCNKLISNEVMKECFIPHYENKMRYLGSWHISTEVLFPGYIFMVSDHIDELRINVSRIPSLIRILGDGNEIIPLYDKEVEFLMQFGKAEHLIKMSQGYIENKRVIITDGPMKDYDGTIKKIDRHKRRAVIEVEFFGRTMDVTVGMELVKSI